MAAIVKSNEEVLKEVQEKKINVIQLWFVDILGVLKCVSITPKELKDTLIHGKGFDGSSITGFAEAEESDIIAMPDPNTFKILPWVKGEPVARMFCDILNPDKSPYQGDPRYVLRRNLKIIEDKGLIFNVGPEIEYFYFKNSSTPEILDSGAYFDLIPNDLANDLRNKTVQMLEGIGISIEASHHEVAPSQHEIDPAYSDALSMADNIITMRYCIKEVAEQHGVYATFMPKPLYGENGSGMHVHQSIFTNEGKNTFFDARDKYSLSKVAKQFIAGQLKHVREISVLLAPWVNSYKRLVSGYEAPVYVSWAQKNRTSLIRVPVYRIGNEKATRIELRCPDPSCNPYLAFSTMLVAGLRGVEKDYVLSAAVEPNIYKMEMAEIEKRNLANLPGTLLEAIHLAEKSELVKETLGEHIFVRYIHNKKKEWEDYRTQITSYEIKKYLPLL